MLILGKLPPMTEAFVRKYSGDFQMKPWKWANVAGASLMSIILSIYIYFADISVVVEVDSSERSLLRYLFSVYFGRYLNFRNQGMKKFWIMQNLIQSVQESKQNFYNFTALFSGFGGLP